jgi:hypothetical protein
VAGKKVLKAENQRLKTRLEILKTEKRELLKLSRDRLEILHLIVRGQRRYIRELKYKLSLRLASPVK